MELPYTTDLIMKLSLKSFFLYCCIFIAVFLIQSCKKDDLTPVVLTTAEPAEITQTSVVSGGNIKSDDGAEIIIAGVCYGISDNPSVRDMHTNDGRSAGNFTSNLTGLTPNTKYYIRAYAYTAAGTSYGNELSFTTSQIAVATLTTAEVTSITAGSAISGGNITGDGGGIVTGRGVCWGIVPNPTIEDHRTEDGQGTGSFTSYLSDLQPVTIYFIRTYATNSAGTSYGNEISFKTLASAPVVTTVDVSLVTAFTAKSGGTVLSDCGGGDIMAKGVCWGIMENPTTDDTKTDDGAGMNTFTSILADLKPNTTYFVRAYATNVTGTGYGNQFNFTTRSDTILFNVNIEYGTMKDIDGNTYKTVQAGTQTWMAENLRTTHFNDGTPIAYIEDNILWDMNATGAFCYYENDFSNKYLYGALYNWLTVNTGSLCPAGWHVPSDQEWTILSAFTGGAQGAGSKLKETGIIHWSNPNTGAINETGFTALPGGYRLHNSGYYYIKSEGNWWSATGNTGEFAYYRSLSGIDQDMKALDGNRKNGYSVRCIKD